MPESFKVYNHIQELEPQSHRKWALTLGNFDGLHLGHQQLLAPLQAWQLSQQGPHAVVTFNPHPRMVLDPSSFASALFDLSDQETQLMQKNIQALVRHPFSREFSLLSKEEFFKLFFASNAQVGLVVVGDDFRFARGREGQISDLQNYCDQHKIELKVIPSQKMHGERISSSRIREFLQAGELMAAQEMLGRAYYQRGRVIRGDGRGRQLGFPTANIDVSVRFQPKVGVYAGYVFFRGQKYASVANLGFAKTFDLDRKVPLLEVHLLDQDINLYGETIEFQFQKHLRDEKKFSSFAELKAQIQSDSQQARLTL